ncbi:NFACT RNA binding domain-containing protein [Atopococcus tabaci]|uniref:NFACT RNA binding domain-containing protein n=1 Tax=Atopococcus tabaci TaxID=269774 RepID=UPI00240A4183|nr:NFACT RNA binding domain-containing protein [Atopococcus tabaci]
MSFDGIFTRAMTDELNRLLKNGRVAKINQPYANEVILTIRSNRKNHRLLLSAHPQYARIQLTEVPFDNPMQPPQFCMVMRKHLDGAILDRVEQMENDRVIHFYFKSRDELGDIQDVMLVAEIMGRHSNLLLVDEGENKILDLIRHVSISQNSYRTLLPGAPFKAAPNQEKLNPFTAHRDDIIAAMEKSDRPSFEKKIQDVFQGIGRDTAQELAERSKESAADLPEALKEFLSPIEQGELKPTLVAQGRKTFFTPIPYVSLSGEATTYDSLGELLDAYYGEKAERDRVQQQASDLIQVLKNELDKNRNKLKKIRKELDDTQYAEDYRIKGEVLTAYLHEVKKGQKEITLPNFYDEEQPLTIQLDSQKSPADNAQKLFSRYQKLKSASIHLTEQIRLTENEIQYLDSVMTQLKVASPGEVDEIREELIEEGYLRKRKRKNGKQQKRSQPEKYLSSDGTEILVGKNNRQNDQLTMKTARKTDWWLHAKDIPGSHVIIRSDTPSEETVLEAAHLAGYYSKSRLSSSVPIDVVQVKQVRKPNGAKPGFVIYEGQRTVYVTPAKEVVENLKAD